MITQEEFDKAVKTIQTVMQEKRLMATDWSKDFKVPSIYIDDYRVSLIEWYSRDQYDDREPGLYLNVHAKMKVIDPVEVIKLEREKILKEHAEISKKASSANAEYLKSQEKLRELENKLVQLGEG